MSRAKIETAGEPSPADVTGVVPWHPSRNHRGASGEPDGHALARQVATSAQPVAAGLATRTGEESRLFLQERLAFLGRAEALLTFGFYTAGNLVGLLLPSERWKIASSHSRLIIPASGLVYLAAWLVCRRGRLPGAALLAIDATVAVLTALLGSFIVLSRFPGEIVGLTYARMLLIITFGFVIRAVVVPSSARRTLILGLAASVFPVLTSHAWYRSGLDTTVPATAHDIWTALWCLGSVAIATLASHVIFGLRRQVREAWQLGQYTLLEKIGEGAMGAVYRASHAMLRRPTAVKLLHPDKAGAEQLRRFEREVQLTSRLTHPSTVVVFDYGSTSDGVFYYAMEYLEGLNLEDLVRLDGRQPAGRVVHVLRQVAGSLAEAHGVGLIHRDVKPANVILVPERGGGHDVVKVVDFGLVKDLDQDVELSHDALIAGTPHYLSPEAINAPERVDSRSDLYSLGCVGYYLLTGHRVFVGRTVVEVCSHHLKTPPVPPAQRLGQPVPETLAALIMECLQKDPDRRPHSARELLRRLDSCHDVEAWTDEEARAWWQARAPRLHAHTFGEAPRPAAAIESIPAVGGVSFIRRAAAGRV